jgi:putative transposase
MMTVPSMVATHERMPNCIVCDDGKEFYSDAFDNLCDLNDTTIDFRPTHESRFVGVIERQFSTTNTLFTDNLVGKASSECSLSRSLKQSQLPSRPRHSSSCPPFGRQPISSPVPSSLPPSLSWASSQRLSACSQRENP